MRYLGSKRRFAKYILPIILHDRSSQAYVEPFCGGCNSLEWVSGKRYANDIDTDLIAMWQAATGDDWQPPALVREAEYNAIKGNPEAYPAALRAYVSYSFSYGGKLWGGYAREPYLSAEQNEVVVSRWAYVNLLRQARALRGVRFSAGDYRAMTIPARSIIYCDPPYSHTTGYGKNFDMAVLWDWARARSSEGHQVYLSCYAHPEDFMPIWQKSTRVGVHQGDSKRRCELLVVHEAAVASIPPLFRPTVVARAVAA